MKGGSREFKFDSCNIFNIRKNERCFVIVKADTLDPDDEWLQRRGVEFLRLVVVQPSASFLH